MTGHVTDQAAHRLTAPTWPSYSVTITQTAMSSGQASVQMTPVGAPAMPVCVWCHGLDGQPTDIMTPTFDGNPATALTFGINHGIAKAIAAAGFPVIAVQMHDNSGAAPYNQPQYGNDVALADLDEAVTYARANMGASSTGRIYGGQSGGGQDCFLHAKANLSDTIAIGLIIPLLDLNGWYRYELGFTHPSIVRARMNTAYAAPNTPTGGWTANAATRDPTVLAASLASVPMRIWYGTGTNTGWDFGAGNVTVDGDQTIPAQTITDFAAAYGANCELVEVPGMRHDWPTPVPGPDFAAFFARHYAISGLGDCHLVTT